MEPNDDFEWRGLLREWQVPEAPAWLEGRVMTRRAARRGIRVWSGAALLAVGGAAASLMLFVHPPAIERAAPVALSVEQTFVPVPNVLPLDSYETGRVLRMDLPVSSLLDAGFTLPDADPTSTVRADVLVGEDGRAHAVRLVPETESNGSGD